MSQIKDQASIVGRVHARLKDASGPMTIRQIAETLGCSTAAVTYATKVLRDRGTLRRVPYRPLDAVSAERYGWEYNWTGETPKITLPLPDVDFMNLKAAFTEDDVRIKVNEDRSITIITGKIRVTIEVPR